MDGTAGDWARIERGRKAESAGIFTLQLALDTYGGAFFVLTGVRHKEQFLRCLNCPAANRPARPRHPKNPA
jgi:hypothetical protein